MSLRQAAQQALEALIPLANAASPNERECLTDEDHERAAEALEALCAALAEPQTTHWEGCEAVHPECRKPEQEPVAWMESPHGVIRANPLYRIKAPQSVAWSIPLYTAPTPRKPLTDEEMRECAQAMNAEPLAEGWPELIKFARAIEAKLKEKNNGS